MHIIDKNARCGVIGYGSWATALVKILLENEPCVNWHIRRDSVAEHIRKHGNNPRYLRSVHFATEKLHISDDINEIVEASDIVILAVPSAFLQETLDGLDPSVAGKLKDKFVISAIKGIVPDGYVTVAEHMNRRYGVPFGNIGIITGPCHSEEVALERLSYLTIVSKEHSNSCTLCGKFTTDFTRANPSTDIYGTEYAAVLKNIYAIAAGIAVGIGYGDNFLAVLISNAAVEMNRFMAESYPFERDTSTSAYLGDLLVTSYSKFSRNRTFGTMIGKGYSLQAAIAEMTMVAEGYFGSECIRQVNKRFGVAMPIADCVHAILYEGAVPAERMKELTDRLV